MLVFSWFLAIQEIMVHRFLHHLCCHHHCHPHCQSCCLLSYHCLKGAVGQEEKKAICFPLTRSCAALIPHDCTVAEGSQSLHLVTLAQNPGLPYFGVGACLVILLTILCKSTRMNSWSFNTSRRLTVFDNLSHQNNHYRIGRGG